MSKDNAVAMVVCFLMLVVGFAAAAPGLIALLVGMGSDGGTPSCNGEVMHPGDKCWMQTGGQIDVVSHEAMLEASESGQGRERLLAIGGIGLGGGIVLLLGGVWMLRRGPRP